MRCYTGYVYFDVEFASIKKSSVRVSARTLVNTGATYSIIPANMTKRENNIF